MESSLEAKRIQQSLQFLGREPSVRYTVHRTTDAEHFHIQMLDRTHARHTREDEQYHSTHLILEGSISEKIHIEPLNFHYKFCTSLDVYRHEEYWIDSWLTYYKHHSAVKARPYPAWWTLTEPFVGVLVTDSGQRYTFGTDTPKAAFYHGLVAARLESHAQTLFALTLVDASSKQKYESFMTLRNRFSAFAARAHISSS